MQVRTRLKLVFDLAVFGVSAFVALCAFSPASALAADRSCTRINTDCLVCASTASPPSGCSSATQATWSDTGVMCNGFTFRCQSYVAFSTTTAPRQLTFVDWTLPGTRAGLRNNLRHSFVGGGSAYCTRSGSPPCWTGRGCSPSRPENCRQIMVNIPTAEGATLTVPAVSGDISSRFPNRISNLSESMRAALGPPSQMSFTLEEAESTQTPASPADMSFTLEEAEGSQSLASVAPPLPAERMLTEIPSEAATVAPPAAITTAVAVAPPSVETSGAGSAASEAPPATPVAVTPPAEAAPPVVNAPPAPVVETPAPAPATIAPPAVAATRAQQSDASYLTECVNPNLIAVNTRQCTPIPTEARGSGRCARNTQRYQCSGVRRAMFNATGPAPRGALFELFDRLNGRPVFHDNRGKYYLCRAAMSPSATACSQLMVTPENGVTRAATTGDITSEIIRLATEGVSGQRNIASQDPAHCTPVQDAFLDVPAIIADTAPAIAQVPELPN